MNAVPPDAPASLASSSPTFIQMIRAHWTRGRFLCVGLDPVLERLPPSVRQGRSVSEAFATFNRAIIDATADWVCAYKPNAAFYEAEGIDGAVALARTMAYLKDRHPSIPVIYDGKRGDIGDTNRAYARAAFDVVGADAATVHCYLGHQSLRPYLDRGDRGVVIMTSNSNPGAGEVQDLRVGSAQEPLYQVVARQVATSWNRNGNCVLVVGAPFPEKIATVRQEAPDLPLLILGIGAQGAAIAPAIAAAQDRRGAGMIVSASRSILYASADIDFDQAASVAARQLHTAIAAARSGHLHDEA